jgi:hypothetical protein
VNIRDSEKYIKARIEYGVKRGRQLSIQNFGTAERGCALTMCLPPRMAAPVNVRGFITRTLGWSDAEFWHFATGYDIGTASFTAHHRLGNRIRLWAIEKGYLL